MDGRRPCVVIIVLLGIELAAPAALATTIRQGQKQDTRFAGWAIGRRSMCIVKGSTASWLRRWGYTVSGNCRSARTLEVD